MFGVSQQTWLLADAFVSVVGLIILITRFRVHPFVALTIAAGFLGLVAGVPLPEIIKSFQKGFGGVVGFVGIVLGARHDAGEDDGRVGRSRSRSPKACSPPSAAIGCTGR